MSKLEAELQAEFQRAGKLPGATDVNLPDKLPVNGRNAINFALSNSQMARDEAPSIGAAPTSGINLGAAQMIERTASLSLTVKEMNAARTALEELAKQHHGYFAELNTVGQSDAARTLSASLRVPAAELDATRMRNSLVDGYHSAMDSALNVLLFLLQVGPSILFWLLLLFFPARWSWRRLRAVAAQKQSLAGAL